MVKGPDDVYVERKGRIERAPDVGFEGEDDVLLIERIVGPRGLRVDGSSPWADARLPDGSRVQTKSNALGWLARVRRQAGRINSTAPVESVRWISVARGLPRVANDSAFASGAFLGRQTALRRA